METIKAGVREFHEKLAGCLESRTPLAIMRHGETLGHYIPAPKRIRKAEFEARRAVANRTGMPAKAKALVLRMRSRPMDFQPPSRCADGGRPNEALANSFPLA